MKPRQRTAIIGELNGVKAILLSLAWFPSLAVSCELAWDHPGHPFLDVFHVYSGGVQIGTVPGTERSVLCEDAGIVQGVNSQITMTSVSTDGTEGIHSDPATYQIAVPGLPRIEIQ